MGIVFYWAEARKHIKIQMMLARQDQFAEKNRKLFLSILSFPFLSFPFLSFPILSFYLSINK